jgi:hypothetical protein
MSEKKKISYLRKAAAAAGDGGDARLSVPDELDSNYPAISEYMSSLCWPDGSEREVSTLTFVVEDGKLKGCVNDRACKRSLWRSGDTLTEVMDALEEALRSPQAVWRRWSKKAEEGKRKN